MDKQTHQDHAEHALAAMVDAGDATDPLEKNGLLSVASYHAAMASYLLSQEIGARLAAGK